MVWDEEDEDESFELDDVLARREEEGEERWWGERDPGAEDDAAWRRWEEA